MEWQVSSVILYEKGTVTNVTICDKLKRQKYKKTEIYIGDYVGEMKWNTGIIYWHWE